MCSVSGTTYFSVLLRAGIQRLLASCVASSATRLDHDNLRLFRRKPRIFWQEGMCDERGHILFIRFLNAQNLFFVLCLFRFIMRCIQDRICRHCRERKDDVFNQLTKLFGDSGLDNSKLRAVRRRPRIFDEPEVCEHLEGLFAPRAYAAERRMLASLRTNAYNSEDNDAGLRRLRNDVAGVLTVPSVRDYFEELRDWCSLSYEIEYTLDFDDLISAWDCILGGSGPPSAASELMPALTERSDDINKHRVEYNNTKYDVYDLPGTHEYRKEWGRLFHVRLKWFDYVAYPCCRVALKSTSQIKS